MKQLLLDKIAKKEITVGVIGLGYVGLPLAVEKAKAGFRTIGFDEQAVKVDTITGVGFNRVGEFSHPGKYFLYRKAKELKTEGAEVFFLSCMGLATMELVEILEEDLGMPVITSHQASLWACLRHSRINDKLPGLGKLFTI